MGEPCFYLSPRILLLIFYVIPINCVWLSTKRNNAAISLNIRQNDFGHFWKIVLTVYHKIVNLLGLRIHQIISRLFPHAPWSLTNSGIVNWRCSGFLIIWKLSKCGLSNHLRVVIGMIITVRKIHRFLIVV